MRGTDGRQDDATPSHRLAIHELPPGTILGDFRIEELCGHGGVSRVYRARQLSLDRVVALKVTAVGDENAHGTDEGRVMASLRHDHIVPVFVEQVIGSWRLLAMEFVAGPSLAEFVKSRDWAACPRERIRFACRIVRDIAHALAHAHCHGVWHGDIKPANILVAPKDRALLTDFNVAVVRRTAAHAARQPLGGTLSYMAPEQVASLTGSGPARFVDERTDLYSLGLVLFELLTGGWPFDESNVTADPLTAAAQILAIRLSSPFGFPPDGARLSPGLRSIVDKCLAPQPDIRYQTAAELADDLDRYVTHRPLRTARDPSLVERMMKRLRRQPIRSAVAAASALLVASMLGAPLEVRGLTVQPIAVLVASARQAGDYDRRGMEFLARREFESALRCFDTAVAMNPQLATAHHNQGVARFRLGQFAAALRSFDQAIELGAGTGIVYSHRAATRFALGDAAGAQADFATARRLATHVDRNEILANDREFERRRAGPQ